jgi:ABC-type protease/lipase transport system fused ATPase/permease subunit
LTYPGKEERVSIVPLHGARLGPRQPSGTEAREALGLCRHAFVGVGLMSGMINVLYLTGSFFMLEIYDRVLPSRRVPTLVGLAVIAFVLYAFQGVLDVLRGRVLVRIGASLDEALSRRVVDLLVRLPLKTRTAGDGLQPVRDLDQVRSFLSGLGPTALFDLPWAARYVAPSQIFVAAGNQPRLEPRTTGRSGQCQGDVSRKA